MNRVDLANATSRVNNRYKVDGIENYQVSKELVMRTYVSMQSFVRALLFAVFERRCSFVIVTENTRRRSSRGSDGWRRRIFSNRLLVASDDRLSLGRFCNRRKRCRKDAHGLAVNCN